MRVPKLAMALAALAAAPAGVAARETSPPNSAAEPVACCARIDASLSPAAQAAVGGANAFSVELYKRVRTDDRNLFLSPASVSTAMALAYRGAAGQTADELRKVFHYTAEPAAYLPASAGVFDSMNFSGPGRILQTANSIWVQSEMPLHADYLADVRSSMKAALQRVNFESDPEKIRADINAWVATATRDRIPQLLSPGDVTSETRVALVDAVYWKGRWQTGFDAAGTKAEPFTRLDGTQQPAKLMHRQDSFAVVQRDGVQAISLPYVGGELDMVVLLPRSAHGLPKFEAALTDGELARWLRTLDATQPRDTILTLPKMHLEARFDLADTLSAMGAPTAFSSDADFSRMVTFPYPGSAPGERGLAVSRVIHAAWLDVDEEGSEAAAATAVLQVVVSGARVGPAPPPPIVFRADRPFLFLLRDRRTGLILFMGRYVAP